MKNMQFIKPPKDTINSRLIRVDACKIYAYSANKCDFSDLSATFSDRYRFPVNTSRDIPMIYLHTVVLI